MNSLAHQSKHVTSSKKYRTPLISPQMKMYHQYIYDVVLYPQTYHEKQN